MMREGEDGKTADGKENGATEEEEGRIDVAG